MSTLVSGPAAGSARLQLDLHCRPTNSSRCGKIAVRRRALLTNCHVNRPPTTRVNFENAPNHACATRTFGRYVVSWGCGSCCGYVRGSKECKCQRALVSASPQPPTSEATLAAAPPWWPGGCSGQQARAAVDGVAAGAPVSANSGRRWRCVRQAAAEILFLPAAPAACLPHAPPQNTATGTPQLWWHRQRHSAGRRTATVVWELRVPPAAVV